MPSANATEPRRITNVQIAAIRTLGGTSDRIPCAHPAAIVTECLRHCLDCRACEFNPANQDATGMRVA